MVVKIYPGGMKNPRAAIYPGSATVRRPTLTGGLILLTSVRVCAALFIWTTSTKKNPQDNGNNEQDY